MSADHEPLDEAVGPDRRTFVKRLVVGTAFAAPVVSSFTMSGVKAVFGSVPRSTARASNANTTPLYPASVRCFTLAGNLFTGFTDTGGVVLTLTVPPAALPNGTTLCVYRGNLTALGPYVPTGETPVSAYAVKWDAPTGNPHQDAASPITLKVNTSAVQAGDPIYTIDTGSPVSAGPPAVGSSWTVNFTHDPDFVVTHSTPATPVTPPAAPPADTAGSAPAGTTTTPIQATPRTTG